MENVKVLVVAHKLFDMSLLKDGYQAINVGSQIADDTADSLGMLRDNLGGV